MVDTSKPTEDSEHPESEQVEPTPPAESKTDTATEPPSDAATSAESEEGLPEYEPLTPELVEDEALRGDFMLRWAAVLLAVLIGCTEITQTLTLVRIRTGQYLASHGILPPAHDVFSYTANETAWINLSWLNDLVQAGLYGAGGDIALSVATAVLAGISFWLIVRSGRRGVSTWWGSVCAVIALVAVYPILRAGPDVITVVGLAVTMFLLAASENRPETKLLWALPVVFFFWSNTDSHAFVGLAMLAAYVVGRTLDGSDDLPASPVGRLWLVTVVSLLAMLVHPFHWHVLEAPFVLHTVEYPEMLAYAGVDSEARRLWFPLTDQDYWSNVDVFTIAGLLSAAVSLAAMVLNRDRLRWSHALLWLAANGLAVAAGRQLAAAAVVNAVLAGLNGQDWFRANFRQGYSVETAELLFSRGGRAVTVVAFFAIGYLAISGRLMGPEGRRIGVGFSHQVETEIESLERVESDSLDDRPFNFRVEQGDILVWNGEKPFVDSRVSLYAAAEPKYESESDSISELHRELRPALRQPKSTSPSSGRPDLWQEAFREYEVSRVIPGLAGSRPDYETFLDLLLDPEGRWQLFRVDAAAASFYWRQPGDDQIEEFLSEHEPVDFVRTAFPVDAGETEGGDISGLAVWPRERTWYDDLFVLQKRKVSNDAQLARHYSQLTNELIARFQQSLPLDLTLALAVLTERHARRALDSNANSEEAYTALADAYRAQSAVQQVITGTFGGEAPQQLLAQQGLSAWYFALTCDPDNAITHNALYEAHLGAQQLDLALFHLEEVERLTGGLTVFPPNTEYAEAQTERNRAVMDELIPQIEQRLAKIDGLLADGNSRTQVAQSALRSGLPRYALQILEEDPVLRAEDGFARMLYANLLLTNGRTDESRDEYLAMSPMMEGQPAAIANQWRRETARACAATGDFRGAIDLWQEEQQTLTEARLKSVLGMSPAPGQVPAMGSVPLSHTPTELLEIRPILRAAIAGDLLTAYPPQFSLAQLHRALCHLEMAETARCVELLREILEFDPESSFRPLIAFYLGTLTGDPVELQSPNQSLEFQFPPPPPSAETISN